MGLSVTATRSASRPPIPTTMTPIVCIHFLLENFWWCSWSNKEISRKQALAAPAGTKYAWGWTARDGDSGVPKSQPLHPGRGGSRSLTSFPWTPGPLSLPQGGVAAYLGLGLGAWSLRPAHLLFLRQFMLLPKHGFNYYYWGITVECPFPLDSPAAINPLKSQLIKAPFSFNLSKSFVPFP